MKATNSWMYIKQCIKVMRQKMSSKKKGLKGLKIYKDQQIEK